MTITSTIPFIPFLLRLFGPLAGWLEGRYQRLLRPPLAARVRSALTDLTYTKAELLVENALLRHQLGVLHRQLKRPQFNRRDRFWILLLASRVRQWTAALPIIQRDTLLRWHRASFRLFWRFRSKAKPKPIQLAPESIALNQRWVRENLTWGAERLRRKRSLQ